jgi:probable rRNA maturation factor
VTIDIVNESGAAVDELALEAVARFSLDRMRIHPLAELSVLIVDEVAMTELHERSMDELRPPSPVGGTSGRGGEDSGPDPALLGDIVLCPQVATAQAKQAGHSAQAEMELLTVHGILHLLGYDHADPEEEAEMFGLQGQLLAQWRAESDRPATPAPDRPGDGEGPPDGEGPG